MKIFAVQNEGFSHNEVTSKICFSSDALIDPNYRYIVLIMSIPVFMESCSWVLPTFSTIDLKN